MRQNQRVAVLLGVTALAAPVAAAPAQAASPFKPVNAELVTQKAALGKKSSKDLKARVKRARTAYDQRRWCLSVKELSGVVKATKRYKTPAKSTAGAAIADDARAAQATIFNAHAKKTKSCGLPVPKVSVGKVPHETKTAPGNNGQGMRQISAFAGEATLEFASDEVIIASKDPAAVDRFVKKWKGTVLEYRDNQNDADDTWLARIDASAADTSGLAADLRTLDPAARGNGKLSDTKGLKLLAVVADAATHGLKVSLNTVVSGNAVEDRFTFEGAMSSASDNNGFTPWYNATGGVIDTGEAWRTLKIAGADKNRVKLAVVDGGFAVTNSAHTDFAGRTGDWGQGQNSIGCSGGNPCPWHGTNVASTAAGIVDNGFGVAGTGGTVADVQAVQMAGGFIWDAIDAVYEAFEAGAKVINISSGYEMDALVSFINIPYEDATQEAEEQGALVVASAGNDGRDVDAEDCFIVCWEEEWIAPCENDAVLCVGGINADRKRNAGSNFGYEWTENAKTSDVDIFAPWQTWVGPDGSNAGNRQVTGTSFSSPFVAGVAAMMLAAKPSLTPQQLEQGLKATATSSPDKNVSRVVNADDAVKWAFPSSQFPPLVKIDPSSTTTGAYGGLGGLPMKAKVWTVYDSPSCCSYTWTSDKDGQLGTGAEIGAVLSSPGTRTVTVKATNAAGLSSTDSIEVTGTNQGPTMNLVKPTAGETFYRGVPYKLEGNATDPNQIAGVPCEDIAWEITGSGVPTLTATGCQPQFTFTADGNRSVKATVTDGPGAKATVIRTIQVVDPPLNAPPIVSILSPDKDQFLSPDTTYTLKASAVDPDGTETVTGTWTVKDGSTVYTIGTGNQRSWKPGTTIPFNCGGGPVTLIFTATDSDGTSKAEIPAYVSYPPC